MKSLIRSLLLALALTTGAWVQAQTFEQSDAAYERKDYRTAFVGYKKLAEQGHASAQYNLGVMYANGRGVPKDEQQAVVWYRKAAEQGHASAQYNLGNMYANGRGDPQAQYEYGFQKETKEYNLRAAGYWYQLSARQGNLYAQNVLSKPPFARVPNQMGKSSCEDKVVKSAVKGGGIGVLVDCFLFACAPITSMIGGALGGAIGGGLECLTD